MYGDIIPPKKRYTATEEGYNPIHFASTKKNVYQTPKSKKIPVFLLLTACIVIGFVIYHKIYNGTTFSITTKATQFEIRTKIPLLLQNSEKDSLTYSLVYIPDGGIVRDPFAVEKKVTNATSSIPVEKKITITATSTDDTKHVVLINKTNEEVLLRIATRFDVQGKTYTLDTEQKISPTSKKILDTIATSTNRYMITGFEGTPSHEAVFAIADTNTSVVKTIATSTEAISSVPPQSVLALMPKDTISLQKSTIYDKTIEQSAVVVFDERALEDFLITHNIEVQEYVKRLKPFGSSVSYSILVIDYTLNTSPETGKPTSFSSLTLEITPIIENALVPMQFAGFKKETMQKVQTQVEEFLTVDISYSPFWAQSVADIDRVRVR